MTNQVRLGVKEIYFSVEPILIDPQILSYLVKNFDSYQKAHDRSDHFQSLSDSVDKVRKVLVEDINKDLKAALEELKRGETVTLEEAKTRLNKKRVQRTK